MISIFFYVIYKLRIRWNIWWKLFHSKNLAIHDHFLFENHILTFFSTWSRTLKTFLSSFSILFRWIESLTTYLPCIFVQCRNLNKILIRNVKIYWKSQISEKGPRRHVRPPKKKKRRVLRTMLIGILLCRTSGKPSTGLPLEILVE